MQRSRSEPRVASRRAVALVCALLLTFAAAACGPKDSTQDTSGDPVAEDTGAPETEDTSEGEQTDDSGNQPVAVELPGLPIGGNSVVASETLQCVDVGWTSPPDLPDWIGIKITGVEFAPADGFALSTELCAGDAPPCLEPGFLLTTSQRCYVPVTWTGPTLDSDRTMSFTSGEIACPPDRVDECQAFRAEVEAEGLQSIGLEPAPSELEGDGTDGETTATDQTPTDGTPTEESPTEGGATESSEG